jgi:hypothetical protein
MRTYHQGVNVWLFVTLAVASGSCGQFEERAWKSHKKPPRVSFDHVVYELGEIRQGEVVAHDFSFRNLGELDLTVDRTRSTPECAVTLPAGSTVKREGSGIVRVELDTSDQAGELRRTITVYTNDPRKRTVLLTLAGSVVADVAVEPNQLYVGSVTRGSLVERTFTVTPRNASIRVGASSDDNRYFTLRSMTSPNDGDATQLQVHVADDAPFGAFDQIARVPTSSPDQPVLRLRVAGIVRPDLTASPDRLTFGDVPRDVGAAHQLLVRHRGRGRVRVTAAEWIPSFGSIEVETLREGHRYRIRATLNQGIAPGDLASVLRLTTDDPAQPVIEIPVEGRVVDGSIESGTISETDTTDRS